MPTAAKKTTARAAYRTDAVSHLADVTDRMHGLLIGCADALIGCTENSPGEEARQAYIQFVLLPAAFLSPSFRDSRRIFRGMD